MAEMSGDGTARPSADDVAAAELAADVRLVEQWREQPDVRHDVVVVLVTAGQDVLEVPGFPELEAVPFQEGVFTATLAGRDLLRLASRPEVAEITPDEGVSAL
jgi:hypothetical protein